MNFKVALITQATPNELLAASAARFRESKNPTTIAPPPKIPYLGTTILNLKTKEEFHLLIDSIDDERALQVYLELVKMMTGAQEGKAMKELSPEQRAVLMLSDEESFDETQLIDHDTVNATFGKWL